MVWWLVVGVLSVVDHAGIALAGPVEGEPGLDVTFRRDAQVRVLAAGVEIVKVLEEGDAPLAAGSGAEAFGDEGGDRGVFAPEVSLDLPERDVEAEADMVVRIHANAKRACRAGGPSGWAWSGVLLLDSRGCEGV